MPSAGFEPAIPAVKTYATDRTATGIDQLYNYQFVIPLCLVIKGTGVASSSHNFSFLMATELQSDCSQIDNSSHFLLLRRHSIRFLISS